MSTKAPFNAGLSGLAALSESRDWSTTPLGPIEAWPQSLKAVADLVLGSPLAMVVLWGPDLVQIYNSGYAVICGPRHPKALGQPTRECWPEVWSFNAPLYKTVFEGEAHAFAEQQLTIERHGRSEDAWFDLTYSPVTDDAGAVAGVLVTVVETTTRVLADRRLAADRERQRRQLDQARGSFASLLDQSMSTNLETRPTRAWSVGTTFSASR